MRQQQFEQQNQALWKKFEDLLKNQGKFFNKLSTEERYEHPILYKTLCHHYALAKTRQYSPLLVEKLHYLVLQGHQYFYRNKSTSFWKIFEFILATFPQTFRYHIRYFYAALLFSLLPALIVGVLCYQNSQFIYSIMSTSQVANMEEMYDPQNRHLGRTEKRKSETNLSMFGFYIYNNISVGFRTFAGGILLGIGSIFFLLFNGLILGGISGHLTRLGFEETFWGFVCGHGSFELTAIVISGAAGLMLGHKLIAPAQLSRLDALKKIAPEALILVMGAAFMLLIAAFIEAFWSSIQMPVMIKYSVAGILWSVVILYLSFAGKHHGT